MQDDLILQNQDFFAHMKSQGYTNIAVKNGSVCANFKYIFTSSLVTDLNFSGYGRRYCYEFEQDAAAALAVWDGKGHPGGPWIKCKGGGMDILNTKFTAN